MPLPPPKRLRAGRQMQVELCEIPFAGTPKIPCRERFKTVPYGCTRQQAVSLLDKRMDEHNPAKPGTNVHFSAAC